MVSVSNEHRSATVFERIAGMADDRIEKKKYPPERAFHHDTKQEPAPGAVIGRNAVRELLKSGRAVDKIFVRSGEREGSITVLVAEALARRIPVVETERSKLDALCGGIPHQGIVAMAAEKEYVSLDELFRIAEERGEKPFFLIADGIMDPNNLGAVIRTAEAQGVHGLILPKRHSAGLTPAVTKASAGAIEHLAVAKVSNIAQTVEELKKRGVWCYCAEAGGTSVFGENFDVPCALVLGSEGEGVSRIVRERCDVTVSVPMYGEVNSLNVSAAAAIVIGVAKNSRSAAARQS